MNWRKIYLRILKDSPFNSIVGYGAGDPALLASLPAEKIKLAIDGTDIYQNVFKSEKIDLKTHDLNKTGLKIPFQSDVAVCSDVFEHLHEPELCLKTIFDNLNSQGILFAHVPNEFILKKTLKVMLGFEEAIYNHAHCNEWNHCICGNYCIYCNCIYCNDCIHCNHCIYCLLYLF